MLWPYYWQAGRAAAAGTGGPGRTFSSSSIVSTFASSGSEVVWTGTLTDPGQLDGVTVRLDSGIKAGLWFEFRGTKCEFKWWNQSNAFYKIDEGTKTTLNADATLRWVTVATGLADTWHLVHLSGGDNVQSSLFGNDAGCIRVTGVNPGIRRPTARFDLNGTNYRADYAGFNIAGGQMESNAYGNNTLMPYDALTNDSGIGARLRFTVTPDGSGNSVKVYVYGWEATGAYYRVAVDEIEDGTDGTMATAASYGEPIKDLPTWHLLATVSVTGVGEPIDLWAWENACNRCYLIHNVLVTNGTIDATPPSSLSVLGVLGDSLSEADYGSSINGLGWVHKVSMSQRYSPANFALYGLHLETLVTGLPGSPARRLIDIAAVNPDKIVVVIGVNDRIGGRTSVQYQADMILLLNNLIANTTSAIKVPLFYNTKSGGAYDTVNQSRSTWMTALTNARAGCTTPSRVVVWDSTGVLSAAGDFISDELHWTDQGQTKVANDIAAHL